MKDKTRLIEAEKLETYLRSQLKKLKEQKGRAYPCLYIDGQIQAYTYMFNNLVYHDTFETLENLKNGKQ